MLAVERLNYIVEVDKDVCCQCGSCVAICGCTALEMTDDGVVLDKERCMGCAQCTAVCPTRAIHAVKRPNAPADQAEPVPTEDFDKKPFLPLGDLALHISARRSIRDFKPEAPSREVLDSIIQAARYAPTARNYRRVRYAVISDPDHVKTFRELCAKSLPAPRPRTLMPGPALMLIINDLPKDWRQDCIIAATTVDLVARSAGVGCTFAGIVRRCIEGSEEVRKFLREECHIEGLEDHPFEALYLGYPADENAFLRPAVREPAPVVWA